GDVHRVHHVGEYDGDLFVLSRLGGPRESVTALAAELPRRAGRAPQEPQINWDAVSPLSP
ncbi:hypothetical protein, partial [Mycobacterium szulgai]|uniref:hypothetical protein n=1 Tax=Mycobacterium szulgai TaxID=1787 RepID=UPI0021F276FC